MQVINAKDHVLGRLAAFAAKQARNGESIVITNAEHCVISGTKDRVYARYKFLADLKNKANPQRGPYFYRMPEMFVKRVIRGMIAYQTTRGKAALKRIKVFRGVPKQYESKETAIALNKKTLTCPTITVGEVTKMLGA